MSRKTTLDEQKGNRMITFTGAVGTAALTRDEVIAMHQDNIDAIRRRITLIQNARLGTAPAELIGRLELARDGGSPYPLAPAGPAGGTP